MMDDLKYTAGAFLRAMGVVVGIALLLFFVTTLILLMGYFSFALVQLIVGL